MTKKYILLGWELSYYSGKIRAYLRYKSIPFTEQRPGLYSLLVRIKNRTGSVVMPVVITPEGEWVQDSSSIIDRLEQRFTGKPVRPSDPVQSFAASLLEGWGDEWWLPPAMHARWSFSENYSLFEREAGANLLPYFPVFVQRRAAAQSATAMRQYLEPLGVTPCQTDTIEAWTKQMLDILDAHFARTPFLLGNSPCVGDFGLIGPLYAHLGRDPWPKRELIQPRPHLKGWIDRMMHPQPGPFPGFADGETPPSLDPVFRSMFMDYLPMIEAIVAQVVSARTALSDAAVLPRALGAIRFPLGNAPFMRLALPFTLWKMQRTLDLYQSMKPVEQAAVRHWLKRLEGERLLNLNIPRLRRAGLQVALDNGCTRSPVKS